MSRSESTRSGLAPAAETLRLSTPGKRPRPRPRPAPFPFSRPRWDTPIEMLGWILLDETGEPVTPGGL